MSEAILFQTYCFNGHPSCVPDQEFQKLKRGMESLLASNDEKVRGAAVVRGTYRTQMSFLPRWLTVVCCVSVFTEQDRHIEELTTLLGHYRKVKEVAALPQGDGAAPVSAVLMRFDCAPIRVTRKQPSCSKLLIVVKY
jgi:hypothetical protein